MLQGTEVVVVLGATRIGFFSSFHKYVTLPGGDVTFKAEHKYSDTLQFFTPKIPQDAIKLNSTVTKIQQEGAKIKLQVQDSSEVNADYVLYTPSVGVLKAE